MIGALHPERADRSNLELLAIERLEELYCVIRRELHRGRHPRLQPARSKTGLGGRLGQVIRVPMSVRAFTTMLGMEYNARPPKLSFTSVRGLLDILPQLGFDDISGPLHGATNMFNFLAPACKLKKDFEPEDEVPLERWRPWAERERVVDEEGNVIDTFEYMVGFMLRTNPNTQLADIYFCGNDNIPSGVVTAPFDQIEYAESGTVVMRPAVSPPRMEIAISSPCVVDSAEELQAVRAVVES